MTKRNKNVSDEITKLNHIHMNRLINTKIIQFFIFPKNFDIFPINNEFKVLRYVKISYFIYQNFSSKSKSTKIHKFENKG